MTDARVIRSDAGEVIEAAGVRHRFALTATHTDGRLSVERFVLAPGQVGALPHIHGSHDETFVVLSGELTVVTSGGDSVLGQHDLAYAPRGSLHGYRNAADVPVVALCVFNPAGYEGYFREIHAAAQAGHEITPELLAELRSHYDTVTSD